MVLFYLFTNLRRETVRNVHVFDRKMLLRQKFKMLRVYSFLAQHTDDESIVRGVSAARIARATGLSEQEATLALLQLVASNIAGERPCLYFDGTFGGCTMRLL